MLRSDSLATLDSGQTVSTSFIFRLPDGPAASASPHKQQHQVRVLIDAIISHTAPRLHQKNTNVNFHVKYEISHCVRYVNIHVK